MAGKHEPKVVFPWESRRGVGALFRRSRARQVLLVAAGVALFVVLEQREQFASQVRSTRATITTASNAVGAWRADHDRACPVSLTDLVAAGYLRQVPRDAWGHPLRVVCPGRKDPRGVDVSSDGPDGDPGGLDRVE